ncbi:MAG: zinc-binding dehydrogenase, partial [Acidimicrobiia bacterium]|nr:zinc-binding dehydrogenase [Acidimicrobiia bacterium]
MKALVASPGAVANIDLVDVDDVEPRPDHVVVDVRAVSMNRGEVRNLQTAEAGWRPGWDVAGVVSQGAPNGSGPREGAHVVGLVWGGGWSEKVAVPTNMVAPLPDEVTFEAAATLPVAGMTARKAIEMAVVDGNRVAVTGAAGGVGRFAVQLAAQNGAHVTAVVGSTERGAGLAELGASEIVVGTLAAYGEPFDLILESAGGESLAAALMRVAPEGTVVSYGNSSGEPTTFDVSSFYGKGGARLYALVLANELGRSGGATTDLGYLANLVAIGHLDVGIDRTVECTDIGAVRAACRDLLDRKINGKA